MTGFCCMTRQAKDQSHAGLVTNELTNIPSRTRTTARPTQRTGVAHRDGVDPSRPLPGRRSSGAGVCGHETEGLTAKSVMAPLATPHLSRACL